MKVVLSDEVHLTTFSVFNNTRHIVHRLYLMRSYTTYTNVKRTLPYYVLFM